MYIRNMFIYNIIVRLTIFLIVLTPLLNYYDVPGTSFSVTSLSLFAIIIGLIILQRKSCFTISNKDYYLFQPMILLVIYNILVSIIVPPTFSSSGSNFFVHMALICEMVQLVLLSKILSVNHDFANILYKTYSGVCIILIIITILEEIAFGVKGILIPVKFEFLPLREEYRNLGYRFGYNWRGNYVGFSPFFSEPSHMTQYLIPYIFICIKNINNSRNKLIYFVLLILVESVMVFSTSSYGIATSIILIILYMFFMNTFAAKRGKFLLLIAIPIMIIFAIFGFQNEQVIYELETLFTGMAYGNIKSSYRVYRGFAYYFQFPFLYKVFGIGFLQFDFFVKYKNLSYAYEEYSINTVSEYLNGISQCLIYNGLIGLILLFIFIYRLYKSSKLEAKILVIGLIMLYATTSTYLRGNSSLYIIIILLLKQSEKKLMIEKSKELK